MFLYEHLYVIYSESPLPDHFTNKITCRENFYLKQKTNKLNCRLLYSSAYKICLLNNVLTVGRCSPLILYEW